MSVISRELSEFVNAVLYWKLDVRDRALCIDRFVSKNGKSIKVHYAPFEYVNRNASLILVGTTPGDEQAKEALLIAQNELRQGKTPSEASRMAKKAASFKGTMRENLALQFDTFGLSGLFDMESGSDLFGRHENKVHYTSTLRYPVSVDGKPYRGDGVSINSEIQLASYRDTLLVEELNLLSRAVVIPLGNFAKSSVASLKNRKLITNPIINGLYHPSKDKTVLIEVFCGRLPISKLGPRFKANDPEKTIGDRREFLKLEIENYRQFQNKKDPQ